jgi:hypothetical protein
MKMITKERVAGFAMPAALLLLSCHYDVTALLIITHKSRPLTYAHVGCEHTLHNSIIHY